MLFVLRKVFIYEFSSQVSINIKQPTVVVYLGGARLPNKAKKHELEQLEYCPCHETVLIFSVLQ